MDEASRVMEISSRKGLDEVRLLKCCLCGGIEGVSLIKEGELEVFAEVDKELESNIKVAEEHVCKRCLGDFDVLEGKGEDEDKYDFAGALTQKHLHTLSKDAFMYLGYLLEDAEFIERGSIEYEDWILLYAVAEKMVEEPEEVMKRFQNVVEEDIATIEEGWGIWGERNVFEKKKRIIEIKRYWEAIKEMLEAMQKDVELMKEQIKPQFRVISKKAQGRAEIFTGDSLVVSPGYTSTKPYIATINHLNYSFYPVGFYNSIPEAKAAVERLAPGGEWVDGPVDDYTPYPGSAALHSFKSPDKQHETYHIREWQDPELKTEIIRFFNRFEKPQINPVQIENIEQVERINVPLDETEIEIFKRDEYKQDYPEEIERIKQEKNEAEERRKALERFISHKIHTEVKQKVGEKYRLIDYDEELFDDAVMDSVENALNDEGLQEVYRKYPDNPFVMKIKGYFDTIKEMAYKMNDELGSGKYGRLEPSPRTVRLPLDKMFHKLMVALDNAGKLAREFAESASKEEQDKVRPIFGALMAMEWDVPAMDMAEAIFQHRINVESEAWPDFGYDKKYVAEFERELTKHKRLKASKQISKRATDKIQDGVVESAMVVEESPGSMRPVSPEELISELAKNRITDWQTDRKLLFADRPHGFIVVGGGVLPTQYVKKIAHKLISKRAMREIEYKQFEQFEQFTPDLRGSPENVSIWHFQNDNAEVAVHDSGWMRGSCEYYRKAIEAAGDILRESSKSYQSHGYIDEKYGLVNEFLDQYNKGFIDQKCIIDQADLRRKIRKAYERQPTKTPLQEAARQLCLALISLDFFRARKINQMFAETILKETHEEHRRQEESKKEREDLPKLLDKITDRYGYQEIDKLTGGKLESFELYRSDINLLDDNMIRSIIAVAKLLDDAWFRHKTSPTKQTEKEITELSWQILF